MGHVGTLSPHANPGIGQLAVQLRTQGLLQYISVGGSPKPFDLELSELVDFLFSLSPKHSLWGTIFYLTW